MQGSYRTATIVETRNLFLGRLRHRVWMVEEEDRDLLVGLRPDIHRPMNTGARFFPIDLSGCDLNAVALAAVTVLNGEGIASQDHCHSLKWIAMPRQSLAQCETKTTHHRGSVMKHDFVCHCDPNAASAPTLQCAPSESTNCASTPPKSCFLGGMLNRTPLVLMSR